jgi:hypothetical protein
MIEIARNRASNPYPPVFDALDGSRGVGRITCGHNPYLYARLVDHLRVETGPDGLERPSWSERPRPQSRLLR